SLIACGLIAGQASAHPNVCPFTDKFTIEAPSQMIITELTSDGNLASSITDDTHFTTSCDNFWSTKSGHAYVTISNGILNCKLTITDGPFVNNPKILSSCSPGVQYTGTEHSEGSKNYTLKFS
ncbi:MAG TPA: hypothetical protein VHM20_03680, partial [Gammaproteobacteria bacterium]|nr:hypothetical protein [Gammaproteobacteria bacterium]